MTDSAYAELASALADAYTERNECASALSALDLLGENEISDEDRSSAESEWQAIEKRVTLLLHLMLPE